MRNTTDGAEDFTVLDVGLLILEAVGVLHARGHQLLRIHPGMSGSGIYWRTAVTHASNFTEDDGYTHLKNLDTAFLYSTAAEFDVAGMQIDPSTTANELADRILAELPDPGVGRDWAYAGWYLELLGMVRRHRTLPIAYADYYDDEDGWEIGWGSGIRILPPPSAQTADGVTPVGLTAASTFTGTHAQFNRYLGPHWRVLVQRISKKHKQTIGACQFDPAHAGPFDAAHIHGRERTTILRDLLGKPRKDDLLSIDLVDFETKFKQEHNPIEKSILVLCKSCHQQYDSPAKTDPGGSVTPTSTGPGTGTCSDESQLDSRPLPITLEPRHVDDFKAAILTSKAAWIDMYFRDGHVERQFWTAARLTQDSNIIRNLRSRPNFRHGKWQKLGIVAVQVTVTSEAESAKPAKGTTTG